jgi:hypothetical protein
MTEVDDSGVDCGASFCVARPLILVDDVCNLEQISDVVAAQNVSTSEGVMKTLLHRP